jgi:hypothetical protein
MYFMPRRTVDDDLAGVSELMKTMPDAETKLPAKKPAKKTTKKTKTYKPAKKAPKKLKGKK